MCHDSSGQKLSDKTERYQTAKGLLDYVKTAMPPGSPGDISAQQYLEIVVFIILNNNRISPSTVIDELVLNVIPLK